MDSTFEVRSSAFAYNISAWCTEKSRHVIEGLLFFLDWAEDQDNLPERFAEVRNLSLDNALHDATKLLAFSCGGDWSTEDVGLILSKGRAGYEAVLVKYGLRTEPPSLSKQDQVTYFIKQFEQYLQGERTPNRTLIHQLLRDYKLTKPSIEEFVELTEQVTMGEISWETYVTLARTKLENFREQYG